LGVGNVTLSESFYLVGDEELTVNCGTLVGLTGKTVDSRWSVVGGKSTSTALTQRARRCA